MKEIPLTKGAVALVDDDWFPILSQWPWYLNSNGYASHDIGTRADGETVFMHRYITMAASAYVVDHINRDKLDNRRENLRIVKPVKNYYNRGAQVNNTTGYKGVAWDKHRQKFIASITFEGRQRNLGRYDTAVEAAHAYNKAARELFKEHAYLNPLPPPQSPGR